jgi:hypothetical protein
MKKLLFVFAIVASFTASAQVQNEVGLVVGPNVHYTTIKFDYGKLTPGVGFAGGITNNLYLGKHLSLCTGAMYEHRRFSRIDYAFIDIWPSRKFYRELCNGALNGALCFWQWQGATLCQRRHPIWLWL